MILKAAAEAFARRAYLDVTITEIAAAAAASDALVYRYFTGKDHLYAAVVERELDELFEAQQAAIGTVADGAPVRDRIRAATVVYLDRFAARPSGTQRRVGGEPDAALRVREAARRRYVAKIRELLAPSDQRRHDYAIGGFVAFLEGACGQWAAAGCPPGDTWPIIDAALGALEGALGDWSA